MNSVQIWTSEQCQKCTYIAGRLALTVIKKGPVNNKIIKNKTYKMNVPNSKIDKMKCFLKGYDIGIGNKIVLKEHVHAYEVYW